MQGTVRVFSDGCRVKSVFFGFTIVAPVYKSVISVRKFWCGDFVFCLIFGESKIST